MTSEYWILLRLKRLELVAGGGALNPLPSDPSRSPNGSDSPVTPDPTPNGSKKSFTVVCERERDTIRGRHFRTLGFSHHWSLHKYRKSEI